MTQKVQIIQKVKDNLVDTDKRHRVIVGGRGKGASWSIARILLLLGMRDPMFIPCVREVQKTIKYSVKKLLDDTIKDLGWEWFYRSTQTEIVGINDTKFVFFGMQEYNSENVKSLEGADHCWIAEAQTLSRRSVNVLRPTIRKDGSVLWWDFNPRYETDPVYVDYILHDDPHAIVLRLSHADNPWFTKALQQEMESDYGRNEVEARHIWEGELRSAGDLFVCPSELVDIAIARTLDIGQGDLCVGADIAHQGGDRIVFYKRHGGKIIDQYESSYQSTTVTHKHLKAFTRDTSIPINIDNGSIGAAVADMLEDDNFLVNRVNFGGTPDDTEHYYDTVTEMYFGLRDQLDSVDIPNDDDLRAELIQRKFAYVGGRRGYEVQQIESKDKFKQHAMMSHGSPDKADALVLCFYQPGSVGAMGTLDHNIF